MKLSNKTVHRHFDFKILLTVILIVAVLCGISFYQSKYWLEVSHYKITSEKLTEPICIVQISDLHNSVFGEDNIRLIQAVSDQQPDLILLTGDMLNNYESGNDIVLQVIEDLTEIAPVYFSYGNHEIDYEQKYGIDVTALFETAGAEVLDFAYKDLECNGQQIRLGGVYGYCLPEIAEAWPDETEFLMDFQATDRLSILMCHMPVGWIEYGSLNEWKADVIFSGHAHGGQVRLPLIGGFYAPDQGWFPGREEGLYYSTDGKRTLVLSRGLGSSTLIPRFNNHPELVVVDIVAE